MSKFHTTTSELREEAYQRGMVWRYERLIDYAPDMTLQAEANLLAGESFAQELGRAFPEVVTRLALYVVRKRLLPAGYAENQKISDELFVSAVLIDWLEDEEKRLTAEWIEEQP